MHRESNLVRGTIHPTSEEAGLLYPLTPFFIIATHCHIDHMEFNFLHTPGHTPGSISVYIDTKDGRVLFGQDIHGPFSPAWGSDLKKWRASMRKLIALKADVLCEGHAGIYRGEKVGKYIESYLKRYI